MHLEEAEQGPSRRNLITGLAAAGVSVPLLAACGSAATGTGSTGAASTPTSGSSGSGSGSAAGNPLVKESQVPVGGGVIVGPAVVTQPTTGVYKAFSSTCTHQGCTVTQIVNQQIICPCHGSMFSISDGSVQGGPAPSPLPPINITIKAGEIYSS